MERAEAAVMRVVSLVLVVGIAVSFARPAVAQQRVSQEPPRVTPLPSDRGPIPPGYHLVERPRVGAIIAGAVIFGVSYGMFAAVGLTIELFDRNDQYNAGWLYVPVAGPFITMALDGEVNGVLVGDALIQMAGIGLAVYGATTTTPRLVRDRVCLRGVGPMAVAGGSGFVLSGAF